MKFRRRIFVVGGAITPFIGKHHPDFIWKRHPDFGKKENPTLEEHLTTSILSCLENTGVEASAIDKGFIGNFAGELFCHQGHLGSMAVRAHEGFNGKAFMRVEGACASGGLGLVAAIDSLNAMSDVAMVAGAEVQTTVSAREGAAHLATASHWESERSLDEFTFPATFARRSKAYREKYNVSEEDMAHVVVKAYANANKNPLAHMKTVNMTLENAAAANDRNPNFLANEDLHDFLKVSDCSQVSDGGAAIILATEEGLKKLGKKPEDCVEILSYGHATAALGKVSDFTSFDNGKASILEAYKDGGISAKDVQVAEVHDCFNIAEILMYEAMGFADAGKGAFYAKEGHSSLTGKTPVNTGGGLMAFGHPVGATGVKQLMEIYRQMKGQCGDYQLSSIPTTGFTANMGGDDRTTVCLAVRNL